MRAVTLTNSSSISSIHAQGERQEACIGQEANMFVTKQSIHRFQGGGRSHPEGMLWCALPHALVNKYEPTIVCRRVSARQEACGGQGARVLVRKYTGIGHRVFTASRRRRDYWLTRVIQRWVEVPVHPSDFSDGHPMSVPVQHERLLYSIPAPVVREKKTNTTAQFQKVRTKRWEWEWKANERGVIPHEIWITFRSFSHS